MTVKLRMLAPRIATASTTRTAKLPIVERKRGWAGTKDRERIKRRDCGICQQCKDEGRLSAGVVVDHIVPLWAGGSDEDENKRLLCNECHDAKTAREAGERGGA